MSREEGKIRVPISNYKLMVQAINAARSASLSLDTGIGGYLKISDDGYVRMPAKQALQLCMAMLAAKDLEL